MDRLLKVKRLFTYDLKTKLIFIEAYCYLAWAYILLKRPFKKVAPMLGCEMEETPISKDKLTLLDLKHISNAIQIMSRHTFWDSKCLVQAIAGMKMLERRRVDSTLYLGIAKDNTGNLAAHAWLRSGPIYVTGYEEMDQFTVVNKFAKKMSKQGVEGEQHEG